MVNILYINAVFSIMPKCTITRTHRRGQPLRDRDFDPPVPGPVSMASVMDEGLKRMADRLTIDRMTRDGGAVPSPIPDLYEPQLVTFGTEGGLVVKGFEIIDGRRYYQSWYIRWE